MTNIKLFGTAVAVLAVGLAACGPKAHVREGEIEKTIEQQAMGKKYIEAIGLGAADDSLTNKTQRMATSRNAAIVAAQHELLTMLKGSRLVGGITVEEHAPDVGRAKNAHACRYEKLHGE